MQKEYDQFSYSLPSCSVGFYAGRALKIIEGLSSISPRVVDRLLMRTDVLLTISGVRSLTLYIDDLRDFLNEEEMRRLIKDLESYDIYLFPVRVTVVEDDEDDIDWIMINASALSKIKEQYTLAAWQDMLPPFNYDRFLAWKYCVEMAIRKDINGGELPEEWAGVLFAPYDIVTGILLGYPGEAISSSLSQGFWDGKYEDAEIPYEGPYYGTSVDYSFGKALKNDKNIVAHQRLWLDIINNVNQSEWHKGFRESLNEN